MDRSNRFRRPPASDPVGAVRSSIANRLNASLFLRQLGFFLLLAINPAHALTGFEDMLLNGARDLSKFGKVLYTAAQTAEVLRSLADKGAKGAISDVGVGLELCRAAMRAARLNILINAAGMEDEVFAMTLRRECELVFEQYGPIIDAGLAAVEARIG